MTVAHVADGADPRVAFAVDRSVGGAVVRNRVRRRLREALRALHRSGALPGGAYLVRVSPAAAELDFRELGAHLASAVARRSGPPVAADRA